MRNRRRGLPGLVLWLTVTALSVAQSESRRWPDCAVRYVGRLAIEAHDNAELAKLRIFAGCSLESAARLRRISLTTAKPPWAYARAWLQREMDADRRSWSI